MKTLFKLTLTIASLILLISCSKDPAKSIVGEWNCVKTHYVQMENGKVVSEEEHIIKPDEVATYCLNSDKTCTLMRALKNEAGGMETDFAVGTWGIVGERLNIIIRESDGGEYSILADIKLLSKKELVLFISSKQGPRETASTTYFVRVK